MERYGDVSVSISISSTITFHTLEIRQEPLGRGDGNDYVVLLIFQMSRERSLNGLLCLASVLQLSSRHYSLRK